MSTGSIEVLTECKVEDVYPEGIFFLREQRTLVERVSSLLEFFALENQKIPDVSSSE